MYGTPRRTLILLSFFLIAAPLLSQTNEEVFREFQFNFSPPGARAKGMGSTFIALADDASATYANPAGLAFLRDPAITIEYSYTTKKEITGVVSGNINFGYTQEPVIDRDLSFFSLNYRFKEWYLALFGHNFLEEKQARSFTARSLSNGLEEIATLNVALGLNGKTYGVGLARRIGSWKAGMTIGLSNLAIDSRSQKQKLIILPQFSSETFTTEIHGRKQALTWSAGLLWHASDQWSMGMVYRENPSFALHESIAAVTAGQPISSSTEDVNFVVPDTHGAGISYKPCPGLHFLLDWQHIQYTQIIEDGFTIVENIGIDQKAYYTTDDVDELHFGVEYLKPLNHAVLAFRTGYYRNPNHFIQYEGADSIQQSLFSRKRGDEESHITIGIGWSRKNQIEVDLAVDFWGDDLTVLASLLWRKK